MASEKRLIDRADLIAKLPIVENDIKISLIGAVADVVCMISECPPVDAVEVVRCKDCKHYRNHPNGLCYAWTEEASNARGYKGEVHCVEPDDFCSFGQRKEDGFTLRKRGRWLNRGEGAARFYECSECHVCGSPQWKVCPVCETKMDGGKDND